MPRKLSDLSRRTRSTQRSRRIRLNMTEEERTALRERHRLRVIQLRNAESAERRAARLEHARLRTRELRLDRARRIEREMVRITETCTQRTADPNLQYNRLASRYNPAVDYSSSRHVVIGYMSHVCAYCQALKFNNETKGLCCVGGKIDLPDQGKPDSLYICADNGKTIVYPQVKALQHELFENGINVEEERKEIAFVSCGFTSMGCQEDEEEEEDDDDYNLHSIKMEPMSPEQEKENSSDDDRIEYNVDINEKCEVLMNNMFNDSENSESGFNIQEVGSTSDSMITEAVSFKIKDEQVGSDEELDIEYNIDIDKEYKLLKNKILLAPNIINMEVEKSKIKQNEDLHITTVRNTIQRPIERIDPHKRYLFKGNPHLNNKDTHFRDMNLLPFKAQLTEHDKKSFTKKSDSLNRTLDNAREKPFLCNICKKLFTHKQYLLIHMGIHTGEKPYSCKFCPESFSQKHNLSRHMKSHLGKKSFSLKMLQNSSTQKYNLLPYSYAHTANKQFSCRICRKPYSRKKGLLNHMRSHTENMSFSCTICKKPYIQQKGLLNHMRLHTEKSSFSCNICKKVYIHKKKLLNHMHTHTEGKPLRFEEVIYTT